MAKYLDSTGLKHYHGKVLTLLAEKADKATTLDGYNIGDAYTQTQIDGKLAALKTDILNTAIELDELADEIRKLDSVMEYIGHTNDTNVTDGSTTSEITLVGVSGKVKVSKGDVVTRTVTMLRPNSTTGESISVGKEFIWTGTEWKSYGDEGSYVPKDRKINGIDLWGDIDLLGTNIKMGSTISSPMVEKENNKTSNGCFNTGTTLDDAIKYLSNFIEKNFTLTGTDQTPSVDKAVSDALGNNIAGTYATKDELAEKSSDYYTYTFSDEVSYDKTEDKYKFTVDEYYHEGGKVAGTKTDNSKSYAFKPTLLAKYGNTKNYGSEFLFSGPFSISASGNAISIGLIEASASANGYMTSGQYTKLSGIATAATADSALSNSDIDTAINSASAA